MSVFFNPFFYIPCILFWINQYLEKVKGIFIPYVHSYWDDILAMPVVFGITLQVFRWIRPLKEQFVFSKMQIFIGWLYFSFLFEILLPSWSATYTRDYLDVLCYAIGAVFFYSFINRTKS